MRALILIPTIVVTALLAACGPDMSDTPAPAVTTSGPSAPQKWEPAPVSNGAPPPPAPYTRVVKGAPPQ